MAKKIVISYSNNPTTSDYVRYSLYISTILVPYANATTEVDIDYSTLEIEDTLTETLDSTVDYLRSNYVYNKITYQRIGNTIEVIINYDALDIVIDGIIDYEIIDIPTETINLKYFIQYKNKVNHDYFLGIYGRNFQGTATEVHGKVKIEKGSIKDHLDSIRGTGLSIDLEADLDLTFEDLYTDNEQDYMVRFFRDGKVIFVGYLKPDGIFQSFTRNKWVISLDCVDGLGALENLSFVKDNGLQFTEGRLTALEIIYYCLRRTGILLPINTSINIYYEGLTLTDELDILANIKMNSDRFIKVDDNTIMSCEEVLKSVLDIFCACITQEDGEWYIFRPNELYFNQIVKFKRYDLENNYVNLVTKNLSKTIGSQIDNFYPHHSGGNQVIKINGGISAFRLGYKYGYVSGLLPNPNLNQNGSLVYEGWTVLKPIALFNDPNVKSGFYFNHRESHKIANWGIIKMDDVPVLSGESLTLSINYQSITFKFSYVELTIKCGNNWLNHTSINQLDPIDKAINTSFWQNSPAQWGFYMQETSGFDFPMPNFPVSDDLEITIYRCEGVLNQNSSSIIKSIRLAPNAASKPEIGEFHTSSRSSKISSIIKENKTVYNGDNDGIIYLGAIFKGSVLENTSKWFRKNFYESKPLLQIASEEQLRIAQKPMKEFSGDLYGFLPYLCVLGINNINGKFMLLEYSYDTVENITSIKALELYAAEISDLVYKFTYDYGNTVKPTIVS